MVTKELCPKGLTKPVTEANKKDFIRLRCYHKMAMNIESQISAFLTGFYEIVPKELISIFDAQELELLISGLHEYDSTNNNV